MYHLISLPINSCLFLVFFFLVLFFFFYNLTNYVHLIFVIYLFILLGSTVATSLCEGEAGSKYVGLLTINGKWFKMEPLELKTVRLMHFDTIKLSDCNIDVSNSRKTQDFVRQKIEDIILDLSVAHSGMF